MRVKRLEIQGFKSFKDKTVVHFDHGITGIVGPNGCGKSNIVDAFFWVMGEQSYKHMRGNSSEDLIFNGSSKYAPLGMAEATLVMEAISADRDPPPGTAAAPTDEPAVKPKEIAVTRRLYRSGEGEYFINGVQARLKDIQELFMDTGVGAKGYSVIEQGQIGKIVNAKPEERRLLIEEAAGIAKYKARKKESLRKMEATQANLSRLNDVIAEIERSVASLERQAQKARQYKKYKDELLDKEMTWGRRKIQVLREKLENLRSRKEAIEQELVGLRAELQVAENAIEIDRVEQVTDSKRAEELQSVIQNLSDELTRERSALDLSRRRQSDLASQLESLETEREELHTSLETETQRQTERETEAAGADGVFQAAAERAREMDEQVRQVRREADEVRRHLETTKRELMSGIGRSSDLTSRAASLLTRAETAKAQSERVTQQIELGEEKVSSIREESERTKLNVEEIRARREGMQAERKELAASVQTHEQEVRQLDKESRESLSQVTQLQSKLQSLEELAQANEGLGDAPKAALDWARESGADGKLLAFADLLDVGAGYESAVEGWMEGRLEHLIAQEAELAVEAIRQVREGKHGRLAIHVGTPGKEKSSAFGPVREALEAAGFQVEGELTDHVRVNDTASPTAQAVAHGAIAHVAVVADLAPLAAFLDDGGLKKLHGWSLLSRDGTALEASGTLRGGSAATEGAASSVLRRKRAIADLQVQVTEAEARHAELETKVTDARQAAEVARARQQALQAEIQTLDVEVAGLDRDLHQMSRALREAEQNLETLRTELENLRHEATKAAEDRAAIEDQLSEFTQFKTELEERISVGEAELATRDAAVREQEAQLSALKIEEASLRERSSSLKRELEASRALIRDRERRLGEINRTLERATQERSQFTGGDSGHETRIEELTLSLAREREELALVKDRLEQGSAKTNQALERIKFLHKTGDQKNTDANGVALEIEKLNGEATHLVQNLEEKYGVGCLDRAPESPADSVHNRFEGFVPEQQEMAPAIVTLEMSADEELLLGEEVERLRERIRRLGEVNTGAIDEYEETKKRFDYLVNERQDLEHSIKNLEEAIEHINQTSELRFQRAFEAIADRFERLFPIIFGGGEAKLTLVYPEGSQDILDAGVDILARPPGKKISNMGLLSGGEKALTAVSMIFAIFLVKPSPFCVLDEVDAPLDDANIGKFNALLREMSAKSQFILITHNKKTMELNDTLYGVTMEEPGVSKMVSIEMQ